MSRRRRKPRTRKARARKARPRAARAPARPPPRGPAEADPSHRAVRGPRALAADPVRGHHEHGVSLHRGQGAVVALADRDRVRAVGGARADAPGVRSAARLDPAPPGRGPCRLAALGRVRGELRTQPLVDLRAHARSRRPGPLDGPGGGAGLGDPDPGGLARAVRGPGHRERGGHADRPGPGRCRSRCRSTAHSRKCRSCGWADRWATPRS